MKEIIQIVKNFTPQQWLNVIFGIILIITIVIFKLYIEILQNDIVIAREGRAKLFELYNECINDKK